MLDIALNLTARLKQPLAPFETPLAPWFEELIEPIYDHGERVVQDHTSRYLELIVQLHTHSDVNQVIEWLETQRAQYLERVAEFIWRSSRPPTFLFPDSFPFVSVPIPSHLPVSYLVKAT
ncbi:hypothetical protein C2W62_39390, partial [Candidatus Entotheonella serta]